MTNQEPTNHTTEVRRLVRMLEKTAEMAQHASLTGTLAGGSEHAVRSYNAVVERLGSIGEIPPGLFPPLANNAGIDAAGIASGQLAEYLRAGLPELEQEHKRGPALVGGDSVIISLGGLGDIGEMIREHLPEWLRGKRSQPEQNQSSEQHQETAGPASQPANPPSSGRAGGESPPIARLSLPPQQARIEELRAEPREEKAPQAK